MRGRSQTTMAFLQACAPSQVPQSWQLQQQQDEHEEASEIDPILNDAAADAEDMRPVSIFTGCAPGIRTTQLGCGGEWRGRTSAHDLGGRRCYRARRRVGGQTPSKNRKFQT